MRRDVSENRVGARVFASTMGSVGWLAASSLLLLFSDGTHTIALAAWLAPACLLRFVRSQPPVRGGLLAVLLLAATRAVVLKGMAPIPGIFFYLFAAVTGVIEGLPFVLDRVLAPAVRGRLGVLVYPACLVAVQFAAAQGRHGSWGSPAYTQAGSLPLLQSLSVFGIWGIDFLIGWFASSANALLELGLRSRLALSCAASFACALAGILLLGAARLQLRPPASALVRIASLSPVKGGRPIDGSLLKDVLAGAASEAQLRDFDRIVSQAQDELIARTEREAAAGAKVVFWSETAAYVRKPREADLLARAAAIAVRHRSYIGLAMGVWTSGKDRPLKNVLILLGPKGEVSFTYLKARPTPGPEASLLATSDGRLPILETPFGRLSSAICYDMDFAPLMAQAGGLGADLVLSPASDWLAIDPRHTQMARFRAIEQGFNLVRQANQGLSAAYDFEGLELARMDEFHSADLTLVAEVPTRGVRTLYSRFGDWFAWLCVAAAAAFCGSAWRPAGEGSRPPG